MNTKNLKNMEHLKTYKIFENQTVLKAGFENAVRNDNIQLIQDLIEQHDLDPSMDNNSGLVLAADEGNLKMVKFLASFPSVQETEGKTQRGILMKYNKIAKKFSMIKIIKDFVTLCTDNDDPELEAYLGIGELQPESTPQYKFVPEKGHYHNVMALYLSYVEIEVSDENGTELGEYRVPYNILEDELLKEIIYIIKNAIEHEILELDN